MDVTDHPFVRTSIGIDPFSRAPSLSVFELSVGIATAFAITVEDIIANGQENTKIEILNRLSVLYS